MAVKESEFSRYEIAKRTGIDEGTLSRFVRGERAVRLETFEKLAAFVKVKAVRPAAKKKRSK